MSKKHDEQHEQDGTEVHVESHVETHVEAGSDGSDPRVEELTDDLKRVQAEFVNYRRPRVSQGAR
jgi:molecular chaperone GrpE (heat shock protein)